jgi:hypothetical protein
MVSIPCNEPKKKKSKAIVSIAWGHFRLYFAKHYRTELRNRFGFSIDRWWFGSSETMEDNRFTV